MSGARGIEGRSKPSSTCYYHIDGYDKKAQPFLFKNCSSDEKHISLSRDGKGVRGVRGRDDKPKLFKNPLYVVTNYHMLQKIYHNFQVFYSCSPF